MEKMVNSAIGSSSTPMNTQSTPRRPLPVWAQVLILLLVLYSFFFSIELLSKAIKMFGAGLADQLFAFTSNPFVALFIGVGATSLMQSSSATTSIVVSMVAAGSLDLELAVPIIMGANVGTSVTNTLVSVGHIGRSNEFRRAFAASTVHDMFNLIAVAVFFPLQYFTGFLSKAGLYLKDFVEGAGGLKFASPLKAIVKPLVEGAKDGAEYITGGNEHISAWILMIASLAVLFFAISRLTGVLKGLFLGSAENWFDKVLFNNPLKALALGVFLTALVQSSSITTSLIVPMAGAGLLRLEQILPYTLGANIGTTVTAIMASMATANPSAIAIALVHLLFNLLGTVMIWPVRKAPIFLANTLAEYSLKSRWIPAAYILLTFIIIPLGMIFIMK